MTTTQAGFTHIQPTLTVSARLNAAPGDPTRRIPAPRWSLLVALIVVQAVVALAMDQAPLVGEVQAVAIAALGIYAAARRDLALIICLIAYIPGAEMLWRQTHAAIYYLIAPYLVILLAGFATFAVIGRLGRAGRLAAVYIALLLPAIVITIKTAGPGSRELVSFALTGPVAFGILVMFTSQVKVHRWLYLRILWIALISAVGPLTVAISSLRQVLSTGAAIEFKDASNFVASGGTAPVQVSALLGMGVLAAILLTLSERDRFVRAVAIGMAIVFTVQCLLTFSRGGMTSVVFAISVLAITQANDRRVRNRIMALVIAALVLCFGVIFPQLDSFTKGAFEKRFTDQSTGRTTLASSDIEIFKEHPLFGVGPGMTKYQRLGYDICKIRSDGCKAEGSSHTEFTRMLSEHGVAGVIAIGMILALISLAFRQSSYRSRPYVIAMLIWGVSQMFYANFRIVAVPFVFALAFVRIHDEETLPLGELPPMPPPVGVGGIRWTELAAHSRSPSSSMSGTDHFRNE